MHCSLSKNCFSVQQMSVDRVSDAFENGLAFASSVTFSSNLLSEQIDFQGSCLDSGKMLIPTSVIQRSLVEFTMLS